MKMTPRSLAAIVSCVALGIGGITLADHDEPGPTVNSPTQLLICTDVCKDSPPCDTTIRWFDMNGNQVAARSFTGVPENGIRQLAYTGLASPVACEGTANDGTTLNIIDRIPNRVVGISRGHSSSARVSVINTTKQYPVCLSWCDGGSGCSFKMTWYDSQGNVLTSQTYLDVPPEGSRQLLYAGLSSPVWCEPERISGSSIESSVQLIDRVRGSVDATCETADIGF